MQYTIISRNNCRWCDDAKRLLQANNLSYEVINLSDLSLPAYDVAKRMLALFDLKTLPQVFEVKEGRPTVHIGGFTELERWVAGQESPLA
jgi:glutaredoxin